MGWRIPVRIAFTALIGVALSGVFPVRPVSADGGGPNPSVIVLKPDSQSITVGATATVQATVTDAAGNAVSGVRVSFQVVSGPNAGQTGSGSTDSGGATTFQVKSSTEGTDAIQSSFVDAAGTRHVSNTVTVTFGPAPPPPGFVCPAGPLVTNFPVVTALVTVKLKPYTVSYGKLTLTWTAVSPTPSSSVCTLRSSAGALPIFVTVTPPRLPIGPPLPPVSVQAGTSIAVATLDFFKPGTSVAGIPTCVFTSNGTHNNCFLNTPGAKTAVVRWHTDSFRETVNGVNLRCQPCDSGPLTFFVDVSSLFPGAPLTVATLLQPLELFIHRNLIKHLPSIDRVATVQDPPNDVLVRDGHGNLTGRRSDGSVVTGIPGSIYIPAGAGNGGTVVIFNQPADTYSIEVAGGAGGAFALTASEADLSDDGSPPPDNDVLATRVVTEVDRQGTLGPSGRKASCFSTDPAVRCIDIDILTGSDEKLIRLGDSGPIQVAMLADASVHASDIDQASIRFGATGREVATAHCAERDVNGDGLTDLVCDFEPAQAGFTTDSEFGILTATTGGGLRLSGSDAVHVVAALALASTGSDWPPFLLAGLPCLGLGLLLLAYTGRARRRAGVTSEPR